MRRILIILIILVLAVLASGCGGDEGGGGGDGGGGTTSNTESPLTSPPAATTPSIDLGCTPDLPRKQVLAPQYAVLVDVCRSEDRPSLRLTNVSSAVLNVWSLGPSEPLFLPLRSDDKSPPAMAMQTTVAGYTPSKGVLVAPGAGVLASSDGRFTLDVAVNRQVSVTAYAAKRVAAWVYTKMQSAIQRLAGGVSACAQTVATVYQTGSQGSWEQALGDAIAGYWSCRNLFKQVSEAVQEPPKEPAVVADDVARVSRGMFKETLPEILKLVGRVLKVVAEAR